MSKFIKSFTELPSKPKKHMKFYSYLSEEQWAFYPIPFMYIYFDVCQPHSHQPIWRNQICGLYLSCKWLKYNYTFGISKKLK